MKCSCIYILFSLTLAKLISNYFKSTKFNWIINRILLLLYIRLTKFFFGYNIYELKRKIHILINIFLY